VVVAHLHHLTFPAFNDAPSGLSNRKLFPPVSRRASHDRIATAFRSAPPRHHSANPPHHRHRPASIAARTRSRHLRRHRANSIVFFRCSAAVALVEYILVGVAARFNELGGG
jgi:hypothetical protein